MWKIARQSALPAGVVLLGVAALVYGAWFHRVPVSEEKEREVSVAIPSPFGTDMWGDSATQPALPPASDDGDSSAEQKKATDAATDNDGNPFGGAPNSPMSSGGEENPFETAGNVPGLPPMRFEKVTEKYEVALDEPEWVIVREVTFAGVVRLANGQLKRTYSGQPPALCPT